jgi:hypothetical protein
MKFRSVWITFVVCLALEGLLCSVAFAENREDFCAELYTKKYYPAAAKCYSKLGQAIPFSSSMNESLRIRKGMFLREAARNWNLAAKEQNKVEVAAFMREKALQLLSVIIKQKLVRKRYGKRRPRLAIVMHTDTKKKIGYAPLSISTSRLDARIEIKGYKFSRTLYNKFAKQVRPGTYNIKVYYKGQAKPKIRRVVVASGVPQVVTFLPNPKLPATAWVGYIAGAAALIGGGIVLTIGLQQLIDASNCKSSTTCNMYPKSNRLEEGYVICWQQTGSVLSNEECRNRLVRGNKVAGFEYFQGQSVPYIIAGGATVAAGVVLFSVAIVAHVNSLNSSQQKQTKADRTASSRMPLVPLKPKQPLWVGQ